MRAAVVLLSLVLLFTSALAVGLWITPSSLYPSLLSIVPPFLLSFFSSFLLPISFHSYPRLIVHPCFLSSAPLSLLSLSPLPPLSPLSPLSSLLFVYIFAGSNEKCFVYGVEDNLPPAFTPVCIQRGKKRGEEEEGGRARRGET